MRAFDFADDSSLLSASSNLISSSSERTSIFSPWGPDSIFSSTWMCPVTLMTSESCFALLFCFLFHIQALWAVPDSLPTASDSFTTSWNLTSSSTVSLTALEPPGPDMADLWTWTWSLKFNTSAFLSVFLFFFLCKQKAARHASRRSPPKETNTTMMTMWCGGLGGGVGGLICGGGGASGRGGGRMGGDGGGGVR